MNQSQNEILDKYRSQQEPGKILAENSS